MKVLKEAHVSVYHGEIDPPAYDTGVLHFPVTL